MTGADALFREMTDAQEEWKAAVAIPAGAADELIAPARERRERACRAALAGGISPRALAAVTGLSVGELLGG
jgi:hypothetical protein